jgi:hypothetical protein
MSICCGNLKIMGDIGVLSRSGVSPSDKWACVFACVCVFIMQLIRENGGAAS